MAELLRRRFAGELLIDPARLQTFCNIPVDKGRYPLDEGGGVVLHAGAHPFQRQADEGVLVKIRDELLVLGRTVIPAAFSSTTPIIKS